MSVLTQAEAIVLAEHAYAVDWVAAACVAALLYDHFITLGQEISRIWPARFSLPKFAFLCNRYILEAMLVFDAIASSRNYLSIPFCVFYLRWLSCVLVATNLIVDGILVMRVWALYHTNKLVKGIALFFYIGGIGAHVGLTVIDYVGETMHAVNDFNILPGCYASSVPALIAGYWITPVIVESVLFVLIVGKALWWYKKKTAPPVLLLLARDSAIYFFVIFVLLMVNLFLFEYGPPSLDAMMLAPSATAGCIAGSRMLLNLRGLAAAEIEETEFRTLRFARKSGKRPVPVPTPIRPPSAMGTGITTDFEFGSSLVPEFVNTKPQTIWEV